MNIFLKFFLRKKNKPSRKKNKYSLTIFLILLITAYFLFRYNHKFNNLIPTFNPTETIHVISEESLIREVRNVNKIIPLEVNLSESIVINKSFGSLEIFKKFKTITFFAKCSYSVDLSQLNTEDILLDNELKQVILTLPQPQIYNITIDESKTKYYQPQLGLLRFGDIELSSEEYGEVRNTILLAFEKKLEDEKLNEKVIINTSIILEDLIYSLIDEDYSVVIKVKEY